MNLIDNLVSYNKKQDLLPRELSHQPKPMIKKGGPIRIKDDSNGNMPMFKTFSSNTKDSMPMTSGTSDENLETFNAFIKALIAFVSGEKNLRNEYGNLFQNSPIAGVNPVAANRPAAPTPENLSQGQKDKALKNLIKQHPKGLDFMKHYDMKIHGPLTEKRLDELGIDKNLGKHEVAAVGSSKGASVDVHEEGKGSKKGDYKAIQQLLSDRKNREKNGIFLTDDQASAVARTLANRGGDASNVVDQIKDLHKKHRKDPAKYQAAVSTYLEKNGAVDMGDEQRYKLMNASLTGSKIHVEPPSMSPEMQAEMAGIMEENKDKNKKFNGIQGLDGRVDLSLFEEYSIKGVDKKTGKKVEIKMSKDDIAAARLEPGRLQNLKGRDLSNLKNVEIDGKVNDTGKWGVTRNVKVKVKDLNKIFDPNGKNKKGEKATFADYEKKSFWSKLWGGIKGAFKGVWNGIKSVAKGAWGLAKGVWKGAANFMKGVATFDFKGAFKNGFNSVLSGVKDAATGIGKGVKEATSGLVNYFSSTVGAFGGAIFGDDFGDKLKKGWDFVGNTVANVFTAPITGAAQLTSGTVDLVRSNFDRKKIGQALKDMGSGAIDVLGAFTGGTSAMAKSIFKNGIMGTMKASSRSIRGLKPIDDLAAKGTGLGGKITVADVFRHPSLLGDFMKKQAPKIAMKSAQDAALENDKVNVYLNDLYATGEGIQSEIYASGENIKTTASDKLYS